MPGTVFLVGAGPGNPDLLTVKAHRLLTHARVVAHDELVSPEILALVPRDAEVFSVGRRALPSPKNCQVQDAKIHPAVIARACEGRDVVRLKGGDPYVFGRGGEEAEALAEARIPFEVVPGISAALGAAASTRLPLTYRSESTSVTFATAHAATKEGDSALFSAIPASGTVVFYMGLARLEGTLAAVIARGRSPETPAAVISHATLPTERVVQGTLSTLAPLVRAANLPAPALLVIGEAVAHRIALPKPHARALRSAMPSESSLASTSHADRAPRESSDPPAKRVRESREASASSPEARPKTRSRRRTAAGE
ncbi:MAG: uroporphyrinogen-III C-methyltransferase [Polyangiaceae bacterium]